MAKTTNKTHKVYQEDENGNLILLSEVKAPQKGSALVAAGQEEGSKLQADTPYLVLGPKELETLEIEIEARPRVTVKGSGRKGTRTPLSEEAKKARAEKAAATRAANKAAKQAGAAPAEAVATPPADGAGNPFADEAGTPAAPAA